MATKNTQNILAISIPNLPLAPGGYSKAFFDGYSNVLRLFFTPLTQALNTIINTNIAGTVTFNASATAVVTFPLNQSQPNGNYFVGLSGNAAGYCWVTNKSITGFTINCSTSNSNTTDWVIQ